ncbi:MAG: indole-3-glycerol phosphate synthase TrpC [Ignavibacteriaceae bacterium]|nr:indole-3-glycerol phosphate synthase TrpC [Ignavibacteriaceae bacterium]
MNILNQIIEIKKEEAAKLKKTFTLNSFREMEFFSKATLSFMESLKNRKDIAIIAEIKKASPSKGVIREDFSHIGIADIYLNTGVDAISILTDEKFFKGSKEFLLDIAKHKQVPLLRNDFIIDEYQVFESKANGADIILLISEVLSQGQIIELTHAAFECGMEVLLELHTVDQLQKINFSLNKLIGVNNRNLIDFSINLETTEILSQKLPDSIYLVSESGINSKFAVSRLKKAGTNAILVGEYLMQANDVKSRIQELKEWCKA